MAEIRVLPQNVADKIAAGEVVERPSAVVKELVENSIDAGADAITVEIKNGGISYISIEDNGKGIPKDELESAFLRHATSKLREIEDLFEISTMGFRGEALSSICAVAEVRVISRTKDDDTGVCMTIKHGVASPKEEIACNAGTLMVVENLFANVPARMKFLKKDSTEAGYVTDVLGRIALARPEIAFRFICDGKEIFSTSGDGKLKNAILNIYGIDHAKAVLDVDYSEHGIRVSGVVGKAELARGNRTRQTLFVNGRYIKNHVVSKVVEEAFRNVLMTGKFPFFVLNIKLSPSLVDVNVHPAKTEIKFANEKEIYNIVHASVKNALYTTGDEENRSGGDASAAVDSKRKQEIPDRKIIREFLERTIPSTAKTGDEMACTFNEPRPISKETLKEEIFSEPIWKGEITAAKTQVTPESTQISFDFAGETEEKKPQEAQTKVIGQVFDTYIIAQKGDEMFLIDQHAVHERKRFEMLKKDFCENSVSGQVLLAPIVFDLDMVEMQVVRENKDRLLSLGFLIEEFGKGSAIIRETPYAGDEDEIKSLAEEVISALMDNRPLGLLSVEERVLDMVSCKYAIKANRRLSMLEMESALKDVAELEAMGITTCPHGRPIKISYSKYEIEKLFKRIV